MFAQINSFEIMYDEMNAPLQVHTTLDQEDTRMVAEAMIRQGLRMTEENFINVVKLVSLMRRNPNILAMTHEEFELTPKQDYGINSKPQQN